jgi:hypothetical protein
MTTWARVIGGEAIDVTTTTPTSIFHADVAAQFVVVPDGTVTGAITADGGKTFTVPTELPAPVPAVTYPTVAPIDFKLLFTTAEYVAIKGSSDAVVQALYELVQDALNTGTPIYLGTPRVQTGLTYMSANPTASPILSAGRAAAISAGTPATS